MPKLFTSLLMVVSISLISFGYGENSNKNNEPTAEELVTALQFTLPSFIKVENIQVDVSETIGTKDELVVKSSFTGILLVTKDLYIDSALLSNKMVLRKIYAKESEFNLSGIAKSTFKSDKWKVNFNKIDISPEPKGAPLSNFAKNTYVILGSEEEKRMRKDKKQKSE